MSPTLRHLVPAGLLLFAAPASAATPAAYAALDRASAAACIRASGLRDARAGEPVRFSDRAGVDARLVTGRYPQAHMKGATGRMLCLYDRRTRRVEVQDAEAMLGSGAATPAPVEPRQVKDLMWRATEIDGRPMLARAEVTLMLDSGGKVGGKSGCNNYSARYALTGTRLTVYPPFIGTRMACPPAVMAQEDRFQQILGRAESVVRLPDGLIVTASDGGTIRFEPR